MRTFTELSKHHLFNKLSPPFVVLFLCTGIPAPGRAELPQPALGVVGNKVPVPILEGSRSVGQVFPIVNSIRDPNFPLASDYVKLLSAPIYGTVEFRSQNNTLTPMAAGEAINLASFLSIDYKITSVPVSATNPHQIDQFEIYAANPANFGINPISLDLTWNGISDPPPTSTPTSLLPFPIDRLPPVVTHAPPTTPASSSQTSTFATRVSDSWGVGHPGLSPPPGIYATVIVDHFVPKLGPVPGDTTVLPDLDALAALGEFDHFNIEQQVTEITYTGLTKQGFFVEDFPVNRLTEGLLPVELTRLTGVDPLLGGNNPPAQTDDENKAYWNEVSSAAFHSRYIRDPAITTPISLSFYDIPNLRDNAGVTLHFEDYLVGVDQNGVVTRISEKYPDATNVNFRWTYTELEAEGELFTLPQYFAGNKFYPDLPSPTNGKIEFLGYFGGEQSTVEVPEPSTLAILVGAIFISVFGAKRGCGRRLVHSAFGSGNAPAPGRDRRIVIGALSVCRRWFRVRLRHRLGDHRQQPSALDRGRGMSVSPPFTQRKGCAANGPVSTSPTLRYRNASTCALDCWPLGSR